MTEQTLDPTTTSTINATTTWTVYDPLTGPHLDPELWEPLDLGTGPRLEPGARTTITDGILTLDIASFENAEPTDQAIDNCKHVVFSTGSFDVPADGSRSFGVDLRVEHAGDGVGDYRHGLVSFNVVDIATGLVHNIFSTGERYFAEHEWLPYPGQDHPFTRVVDDPFFLARLGSEPDDGFRRCEVEIDRGRGRVVWAVDGAVLHEASGLHDLPSSVHIGFGVFTLVPVEQGGASVHGQGARASWRNFTTSSSVVTATPAGA